MESFFLAETIKYLYLLFDPDNFLHGGGTSGVTSWEAGGEGGQCVLGAGGFIFNTEAHPLDPAALYCCSQHSRDHQELRDILFSLSQPSGESNNQSKMADSPAGQSESIALKSGEKRKTPPLLSCPVQPFRARLSVLGQVFTDSSWHITWSPVFWCHGLTVQVRLRKHRCHFCSHTSGKSNFDTLKNIFSLTLKAWKCFCLFKYGWSFITWF